MLGHVGIAVKPIEKSTRKACLSFTHSEILRIDFLLAAAHTHKHRYHPVLKIKIHIVLIYTEDYLWMYPANIYLYIYILSNTIHQLHVAMLGVSHKPLTITLQIKRIHLLVPNVLPDNSTCGLFLGLSDPFNGFV